MKNTLVLIVIFITSVLSLSACNEATAPVNVPAELEAISPPSHTASSTVTKAAPTTQPTLKPEPSLTPLVTFEPILEVGSTHLYVDGTTLIAVPAGEFTMGNGSQDSTQHEVYLDDFWVYLTKVTNQQYALCVQAGVCTPPDSSNALTYFDLSRQNDPVVGVNFAQAQTYCTFVNGRLPTEAEWEMVARGPEGNVYPWGNTMPQCNLANYQECIGTTTSVTDNLAGRSYYGGMQFAGNAQEWVADWYGASYYTNSVPENPAGPSTGQMRSIRGSSYDSPRDELEAAIRGFADPNESRSDLGFRCVVEDPEYFAPFCEVAPVVNTEQASASQECPEVSISQMPYCISNIATTRITFEGPQGATVDSGDCVPGGTPGQYTCQEPGLVSITAGCVIDNPVEIVCPLNYSLEGNKCVANGDPGECMPGWKYDTGSRCCSASLDSGKDDLAPLCPVGSFFDDASQVCLPYPSISTAVQFIEYMDCSYLLGGTDTALSPTLVPYEPTQAPSTQEDLPPVEPTKAAPTIAPTIVPTKAPSTAPTSPMIAPTPAVPTLAPTVAATPVPATPAPIPPTAVPTDPPPVCQPQDCSDIPDGEWDPDLCCCKESGTDFCY
jgi:formylglycine-generating enzyme required for sulfatase activity